MAPQILKAIRELFSSNVHFQSKTSSMFRRSSKKRKLKIHVTTGDRLGAGTDSNVYISFLDAQERKSEEILLDVWWRNDLERGTTGTYTINLTKDFGRVNTIEIHRDSKGLADSWYLEKVVVEDEIDDTTYQFPVHRWIPPHKHFRLREYDCSLPQWDQNQEQRAEELKKKRESYEYEMKVINGPVQCKTLPADEQFSGEYLWDIISNKLKLRLGSALVHLTTGRWTSLADLTSLYRMTLEEPQCVPHWTDDYWFGLQRVQGTNPVLIQLCESIPDNFGVTAEMVEPLLEGMTLDECLENKKIFIVDLTILEDICTVESAVLCAPLALFYLNKKGDLRPIAIQLFPEYAQNNPVFLPTDPPYTWLLAKMYYNNADAMYHQSCTHLGQTHLLMEGVVVCTHRNLSPSHPVFRLLAPHFLFLLAINARGLEKLVSPDGWVDRTTTVGRAGMFSLIKRGFKKWRMDTDGFLPNEFKRRRVDDPSVLPHYPYRDDSLAIYAAIKRYVTKIIQHHYDKLEKVLNDWELQEWRKELAEYRELGGVGLQGIPGNSDGLFDKVEDVIEVVTAIIAISSIGHSAANFLQYNEYGFPPNYPGILYGLPPSDKTPLTEDDIISHLPDKKVTLDIITITSLLSTKGTRSLGDFEVQYLYDPVSIEAAEEFKKELNEISEKIVERNTSLRHPYPWLDPANVPNSISI